MQRQELHRFNRKIDLERAIKMELKTLKINQKGELVYISFPSFDKTGKVANAFTITARRRKRRDILHC